MRVSGSNPIILLALCATCSVLPQEAKAIGRFGQPYPSFVMRTECVRPDNVTPSNPRCPNPPYAGVGWQFSKFVWWEWDPPAGVTALSLSFYFDPTLFAPVPGSAGFLCSFTASGNCPVESPGVGTQPLEGTSLVPTPGSATGTQTITIGPDSVDVEATFSPPATSTDGELFFAMKFEALFPTDTALIEYSQGLLPGASYYVKSYGCTTEDGANSCGSQEYTQSFLVIPVPEPGTLGLVALGAALVGYKRKTASSSKKCHAHS